jgi:hypothetical protein
MKISMHTMAVDSFVPMLEACPRFSTRARHLGRTRGSIW